MLCENWKHNHMIRVNTKHSSTYWPVTAKRRSAGLLGPFQSLCGISRDFFYFIVDVERRNVCQVSSNAAGKHIPNGCIGHNSNKTPNTFLSWQCSKACKIRWNMLLNEFLKEPGTTVCQQTNFGVGHLSTLSPSNGFCAGSAWLDPALHIFFLLKLLISLGGNVLPFLSTGYGLTLKSGHDCKKCLPTLCSFPTGVMASLLRNQLFGFQQENPISRWCFHKVWIFFVSAGWTI